MYKENMQQISDVIDYYFNGIYTGNTSLLRSVFHPKAILFGHIQGQTYLKTLEEYLEGVQNRKSPQELGEGLRMKIISIEVLNDIAYARLHVPMFDFNYYDYLALSKIDERWVVVNKLFTHVSPH